MQITFLGTGSAFIVGGNYQSNLLLSGPDGRRLLLDCGSDARHSLFEQGLSYLDIEDVYVSHLHGDHAGGLEWLGFTRKFDPRCQKPRLYVGERLAERLWDHVLSGGMGSLDEVRASLSTYFELSAVARSFDWNGGTFRLVETHHVRDGEFLVPCYGLLFAAGAKKVFWTSDTRFDPDRLMPFYLEADLILHDCETSPHPSGVHSSYRELTTLPPSIRAKMWLYHYQRGPLPDAPADGFLGFASKGQVLDLT